MRRSVVFVTVWSLIWGFLDYLGFGLEGLPWWYHMTRGAFTGTGYQGVVLTAAERDALLKFAVLVVAVGTISAAIALYIFVRNLKPDPLVMAIVWVAATTLAGGVTQVIAVVAMPSRAIGTMLNPLWGDYIFIIFAMVAIVPAVWSVLTLPVALLTSRLLGVRT